MKDLIIALLMGLGILVLMGILFYGVLWGISSLAEWLFEREGGS